MIKRITTLVFAFLTIVGNAVWGQEQISNSTQLVEFAQKVNEGQTTLNAVLTTDIDLSGVEWKSIDDYAGTFDGGGHKISNISQAVFSTIDNGGVVKNLGVKNYTVKLEESRGVNIGTICIRLNEGVISHCWFEGTLSVDVTTVRSEGASHTSTVSVGGICGRIGMFGTIEYCSNKGGIKVTVEDKTTGSIAYGTDMKIGGICAEVNSSNAQIKYCYNTGDIETIATNLKFKGPNGISPSATDQTTSSYIGGVCGTIHYSASIQNCYNSGNIIAKGENNESTDMHIGGVLGGSTDARNYQTEIITIENCYNTGEINASELDSKYSEEAIEGLKQYEDYWSAIASQLGLPSDFNEVKEVPLVYVGGILGSGLIANLQNCYNTGKLSLPANTTDVVLGALLSFTTYTDQKSKAYYLSQEDWTAIKGTGSIDGLQSKTEDEFEIGNVTWLLRDAGYGQALDKEGNYINDETPVLVGFEENKGKEVYQLTLKVEETESIIYRNAIESNLLPADEYNKIISENPGSDIAWYNTENKKVAIGNSYMVTKDETLTAQIEKVYKITIAKPYDEQISSSHETAPENTTITLIPKEDGKVIEGFIIAYEENEEIKEVICEGNTFTMPAADVTITSVTFVESEEPGDGDQGDTGIHKPQRPIKYYNIYVDTICPGLNVEVSKDVVQEGLPRSKRRSK